MLKIGVFLQEMNQGFFILFHSVNVNNLLKTTQAHASYRMLEHNNYIIADQTKTVLCFYKWHHFQTDLKPVVNRE